MYAPRSDHILAFASHLDLQAGWRVDEWRDLRQGGWAQKVVMKAPRRARHHRGIRQIARAPLLGLHRIAVDDDHPGNRAKCNGGVPLDAISEPPLEVGLGG